MAKKKTSKKPGFSFSDIQALELKQGTKLKDHKASERLKDRHYVALALIQCLQDGDADAFKEILKSHLDVVNKTAFSQRSEIPERTLYRMVSDEGNPTLDNIARVVHALCA